MRFSDLFPGVVWAPLTPVAKAVGYSPSAARNKFYAGDNPLGIIRVDGRLVVPAENFDAFLERAYLASGLDHLCNNASVLAPAVLATNAATLLKRPRGRPRKAPPAAVGIGGSRK